LYNLKKRHQTGQPYTRTGDIIIAVNPFQWFTELYTEKKRIKYSNRLVWEDSDKDAREGLEPHVYEVSVSERYPIELTLPRCCHSNVASHNRTSVIFNDRLWRTKDSHSKLMTSPFWFPESPVPEKPKRSRSA